MEDIIKQAKSEYIDRQHSGNGDIYLSMHESDLDKIVKQILQAIVDREEKRCLSNVEIPYFYGEAKIYREGFYKSKQDTIDYLNNEIKGL